MTIRILVTSLVMLVVSAAGFAADVKVRTVELGAKDGTTLKASLYDTSRKGPGVLLFHQCNRDRTTWDTLARVLASSGFHVIAMDFRGFGESAGKRFDQLSFPEQQQLFTQTFPSDVDVLFDYLSAQPGVQRSTIGAAGASCGVNQAIQLARRHPEVKSLVLLSGGTDREGRKFLRTTALPMLTSAAADDGTTLQVMQWLVGPALNPSNEFVRYDAGGHGTEMFSTHPELPGHIVQWFISTLRESSRAPSRLVKASHETTTEFWTALDEPDGIPHAEQIFAQARARGELPRGFDEAIVNQLGYERIAQNDSHGAIAIFKMNVEAFPNSANVYDSLADAYVANNQPDLAAQYAQRALELLRKDSSLTGARRDAIRQSAEQKLKAGGKN
jgi:dienelactone hydrolase